MKIKYDQEADILIIILKDEPPQDAIEEPGGIIVSYAQDGKPVSVEFLNASLHGIVNKDGIDVFLQTLKSAAL
ncbi:MAG: DUF2283 domain-containing protein [Desulfurella sp.]|uniref:DUF2283 domain-containing protein n=1 Tax=Desulfurella sp. TaxID=1962857 RepID=UPI003D0E6884